MVESSWLKLLCKLQSKGILPLSCTEAVLKSFENIGTFLVNKFKDVVSEKVNKAVAQSVLLEINKISLPYKDTQFKLEKGLENSGYLFKPQKIVLGTMNSWNTLEYGPFSSNQQTKIDAMYYILLVQALKRVLEQPGLMINLIKIHSGQK
jgi:hypothetical protein